MKNIVISLMLMMFTVSVRAQISGNYVVERGPGYIVTETGAVYDAGDIPGSNRMVAGDAIGEKMQEHFLSLQRENYAEYLRQYRLFSSRRIAPVRTVAGGGMMGAAGPMGGMLMGMNGSGGYVYGTGGAASAASNVEINNQNMIATIGSGLNISSYGGEVSVSGDPLMALGRIVSAFGGSKKAARQQAAAQATGNNVRVVYVDSSTGQAAAQPTQIRSARRQAAPARQAGVASTPVYGAYSGF